MHSTIGVIKAFSIIIIHSVISVAQNLCSFGKCQSIGEEQDNEN